MLINNHLILPPLIPHSSPALATGSPPVGLDIRSSNSVVGLSELWMYTKIAKKALLLVKNGARI